MREFLRGCPGILFSCGNFFKCHSKSFQKYFIKREIVSLPLGHPISNNSSNTKGMHGLCDVTRRSVQYHVEVRFWGVFKATRVTLITRQFIKTKKNPRSQISRVVKLQAPNRHISEPFSRLKLARENSRPFLYTFSLICIFIHVS